MGEEINPYIEAVTLIDKGLSGRTPALVDTSAMTGSNAYMTC